MDLKAPLNLVVGNNNCIDKTKTKSNHAMSCTLAIFVQVVKYIHVNIRTMTLVNSTL